MIGSLKLMLPKVRWQKEIPDLINEIRDFKKFPAASYSPTQLPEQYHRR